MEIRTPNRFENLCLEMLIEQRSETGLSKAFQYLCFHVNIQTSKFELRIKLDKRTKRSGVASPTIWSCYANISVLIDRENNLFLKK